MEHSFDIEDEELIVRRIAEDIRQTAATVAKEQQELEKARTTEQAREQAQEILQHLAQAAQQKVHERIARVVSSCLEAVFDDPYEFEIVFERKRGRTEAVLRFKRGELEADPMTAAGGGVVDVAAFALRVACLVMHKPRLSRIVVADEPFKYVSKEYRENISAMLQSLAEEMKIQFIIVTHIDELKIGKVIEL